VVVHPLCSIRFKCLSAPGNTCGKMPAFISVPAHLSVTALSRPAYYLYSKLEDASSTLVRCKGGLTPIHLQALIRLIESSCVIDTTLQHFRGPEFEIRFGHQLISQRYVVVFLITSV
jgi:hypothetical protein